MYKRRGFPPPRPTPSWTVLATVAENLSCLSFEADMEDGSRKNALSSHEINISMENDHYLLYFGFLISHKPKKPLHLSGLFKRSLGVLCVTGECCYGSQPISFMTSYLILWMSMANDEGCSEFLIRKLWRAAGSSTLL